MLSYRDIINKIEQLEEANILLSALELKVFSVLKNKSMSARQVTSIIKTKFEGTEILLNALSAMGALTKNKNTYKNTIKESWFYNERTTRQNTTIYGIEVKLENKVVIGIKDLE